MGTAGSPIMGTDNKGSSAIFGPDGRVISALTTENEKLIFADLDLGQVVKAKTFADASGHCTCLALISTSAPLRRVRLLTQFQQTVVQTCCGFVLIPRQSSSSGSTAQRATRGREGNMVDCPTASRNQAVND